MAPRQSNETSSAPLADWFFISGTCLMPYSWTDTYYFTGVDSEQLRWRNSEEEEDVGTRVPVEPTIEEDRAAEAEDEPPEPHSKTSRKSKRSSYQRLSSLSDEARLSISSLSLSPSKAGTDSNRSSVTIKAVQVNGTGTNGGLNDTDFENALKKFANQRDSFLMDLSLSAGAVVPEKSKMRPKTQKIVNEDLRSGVGSLRRRISFRDMNSMKRQSSIKRQCELGHGHVHSHESLC